jgi:uncharacterized protein YdeI (YjbR/CyaY-like superfamily)
MDVSSYISNAPKWKKEMELLRAIVLDCGLDEDLKWGKPCYSYREKNVCIIQGFKNYIALLFFKGFMMTDPEGILQKTGENTRVGRQLKFTDLKEIVKIKSIIKEYVYDAIELEKAGVKVMPKKDLGVEVPEELEEAFRKKPKLKSAFFSLTPGRQRAYVFNFKQPKQSETRTARIEKYTPQILAGIGINDEYLATKKKTPKKKLK